jgi:hypothetical protein
MREAVDGFAARAFGSEFLGNHLTVGEGCVWRIGVFECSD